MKKYQPYFQAFLDIEKKGEPHLRGTQINMEYMFWISKKQNEYYELTGKSTRDLIPEEFVKFLYGGKK